MFPYLSNEWHCAHILFVEWPDAIHGVNPPLFLIKIPASGKKQLYGTIRKCWKWLWYHQLESSWQRINTHARILAGCGWIRHHNMSIGIEVWWHHSVICCIEVHIVSFWLVSIIPHSCIFPTSISLLHIRNSTLYLCFVYFTQLSQTYMVWPHTIFCPPVKFLFYLIQHIYFDITYACHITSFTPSTTNHQPVFPTTYPSNIHLTVHHRYSMQYKAYLHISAITNYLCDSPNI